MENERRILDDRSSHAEAHDASAERLDSHADAMWAYAGDCDRWGLGSDAAAARRRSVEMRVSALLRRALLPTLGPADDGDPA